MARPGAKGWYEKILGFGWLLIAMWRGGQSMWAWICFSPLHGLIAAWRVFALIFIGSRSAQLGIVKKLFAWGAIVISQLREIGRDSYQRMADT